MRKVAVYTGSRNLYPMMVVAAKSLLKHSSVEEIWFLIEDDEFPFELPDCVKTRNVSDQQYFRQGTPNMKSEFTYFALMRAALAHEFPEEDVVLSLDVDTICIGDVDEIWDVELGDNYFAASMEKWRSVGGMQYCNIGVCLYNLKRLRESGKVDEVIDVLNRHRFSWVEQDVFSFLCQGYIAQLPSKFNGCDWTLPRNDTRIVHYAALKKWDDREDYKNAEKLSWSEVLGDRK